MPANSLIITDIAGGTTSNAALKLSQKYKIHILSGLSAIMLIEAIIRQNRPFTDESIKEINEAAIMNCQHLKVPAPDPDQYKYNLYMFYQNSKKLSRRRF